MAGLKWSVTHGPAADTIATCTRAAGGANKRHHAKAILVTFVAGAAAPTAVTVVVHLRDGATGVGTPLATFGMSLKAVAGDNAPPIALAEIDIPGSDNTAMCLEFAAAGGANTVESVTLIGETR